MIDLMTGKYQSIYMIKFLNRSYCRYQYEQWFAKKDCGESESPGLTLCLSPSTIVTDILSFHWNALERSRQFSRSEHWFGLGKPVWLCCDSAVTLPCDICPRRCRATPPTLECCSPGAPRAYDFHHATSAEARIVCAARSVYITSRPFLFGLIS